MGFAVFFGILRALVEQPVYDSFTVSMIIIGALLLMVGAYYFVRKYEKFTKWAFFSAIIIVNLFYLIFRSLLGLAKSKGGEIENVMNLVGLNFYVAAVLFLILAFTIFFLWNRKFNKKYLGAMLDITCFFSFLVVIMVMEGIDTKFFWDRYPTIEIEHVGIHNPHD